MSCTLPQGCQIKILIIKINIETESYFGYLAVTNTNKVMLGRYNSITVNILLHYISESCFAFS